MKSGELPVTSGESNSLLVLVDDHPHSVHL